MKIYRKKLLASIGLIFCHLICFAIPPQVEIWRNGMKQSKTYSKIQYAIDSAKSGDLIRIRQGRYYENLVITGSFLNPIRIEGVAGEIVIIDGADSSLQVPNQTPEKWKSTSIPGVYKTFVAYKGNQLWKRVVAASINNSNTLLSANDSLLATYWKQSIFENLHRGGGIKRDTLSGDTIKIKLHGNADPNTKIISIGKADAVIKFYKASNWILSNLEIQHGGFSGIYFAGNLNSSITLDKIKIHSTFRGITTEEGGPTIQDFILKNVLIKNCLVSNLTPNSNLTKLVRWQGYADGSNASDDSQAPQRSTGIMIKASKDVEIRNCNINGWWDGMKFTGHSGKAHHNIIHNINDDMVELESSNSKDLSFYSNFGYNLYVGISVINNSGGNVYVFRNRLVNTRPMSTSETKIDTSYGYCIKLGKGWDAKVLYAEDVKFFNNSFFATGAPIWDARYKTLRRFEFINNIFSSGGWKTNFKNKDTLTHTFDNNCIWKNNLWVKEEGLHEPGIKVENSSTATFVNAFTINPYSNSNLNIKNSSKALNMGTNYHKKWNVDTTSISGNSFDIGANESDINSNDSIKMGTSATASFQGLTARYYSNDTSANFSVPVTITRIDTAVNFDWKLNSPDGAIKPDYFTVRWTGKIQAVLSEIYTFYTTSDDYIKLWVNGTKIIDNWTSSDALPSNKLNSTNQAFVAGRKYDIVLEYREKNSNAICKLYWQSPNTPKQIIPSKYFSTSENNTFNYREGEDIFNYNDYFKESEQTISTYPNPAENEIFINITDKLLDNETIKIFNMLGESVLEYHLNDQDINNLITINCSNLPAGHYALHFKNYHKKIIKY